jgi:hypothetical protein
MQIGKHTSIPSKLTYDPQMHTEKSTDGPTAKQRDMFFLLPRVNMLEVGYMRFSSFFNCCCLKDKYSFWTIQMFSMLMFSMFQLNTVLIQTTDLSAIILVDEDLHSGGGLESREQDGGEHTRLIPQVIHHAAQLLNVVMIQLKQHAREYLYYPHNGIVRCSIISYQVTYAQPIPTPK